VAEIASALAVRADEAALIAELKAGSEDAYAWLVAQYHQPVYSLIYRLVNDPADAADTTQEVFLKVFRGINRFHGQSSLKTWIYRIALHEASNNRRWWFRHKGRETSVEAGLSLEPAAPLARAVREALTDDGASPFEAAMHHEVRAHIEAELAHVPEPFRTAVVLRDIEDLSYEEIAEVTATTLGTVKSRLTRGREFLRQRLERYVSAIAAEMGIDEPKRGPESERGGALARRAEVIG
jgi:RNA polymerase sigma-70 factor (ECF subfamily)